MINRVIQKASQEMMRLEDERVFGVLEMIGELPSFKLLLKEELRDSCSMDYDKGFFPDQYHLVIKIKERKFSIIRKGAEFKVEYENLSLPISELPESLENLGPFQDISKIIAKLVMEVVVKEVHDS